MPVSFASVQTGNKIVSSNGESQVAPDKNGCYLIRPCTVSIEKGKFGPQIKHIEAKTITSIKRTHVYHHGVYRSNVQLNKGNFDRPNFGPQTNTKHVEANTIEHATITHVHHHYGEDEKTEESPSTSGATGARPKQKLEEGFVQISDDIFINTKKPLKEGIKVYEGYQEHVTGQRQPLAIKRIVPCTKKSIREVQHLVNLALHPNVVRIIRAKVQQTPLPTLYIAMELYGSKNLQDYLNENREKNTPFDFKKTMSYSKRLIKAMKHIHRNRIIHGDLKPENILFSLDGDQIKVSDFGISKVLQSHFSTKITRPGTDGYRAPETFNSDIISMKADIFSLGKTLYSLWTNDKHSFGEDSDLWMYNIKKNRGRYLSSLPEEMAGKRGEFLDLLDKMLQFDPKNRPTMEEISQHPFLSNPVTVSVGELIGPPSLRHNSYGQPISQEMEWKSLVERAEVGSRKLILSKDNYLPRSRSQEELSEPNEKRIRKSKKKISRSFVGHPPGRLPAKSPLTSGASAARPKQELEEGDEMIELREGLFCNKKTPLREGGRVYKGFYKGGEGMKAMPLAIKIFRIKNSVQLERYQHALNDILKLQIYQECKYLTKLSYYGQSKDGELYIAMTLCHVTSLADINLEKVSPDQRRNIFLQICHGLAFLHGTKGGREPLAHGNLKPSNVLFSNNGRKVLLSDFGLGKVADIDEAVIGKSSRYGGMQGWRAAEQEHGGPVFIKADIFSLGLVGFVVLSNKQHPFADPGDQTDPVLWQANIMKLEPPNLEPLKEDHLAQDLFRKMLGHDPDKRPNIEEVLQHCMFWSPTKKITFLYEIFENYFGSENFKKKMVKTEIKEHKAARKLAYMSMPTVTTKTSATSAKVKIKNVYAETKALNEMREVIGECWQDRVKEMDEIKGTTVYEESEHGSSANPGNSLVKLLRYIRNVSADALCLKKNRKQETIQYWVEAFPQLTPYLLKIMLPVLTPEDKKEYAGKWAEPGDVDVGRILGEKL